MERDKRPVKKQLTLSVLLIEQLKSVQENPLDLTAWHRQLQTAALIRVVTQHNVALYAKYS